ncbi:NAD(P)H-hydrate dehydratase [Neptunicoccus cionae]|uniref:Bifunctional NAD(P)H-hydrate repair enzyme n=1 Tax=Neptunicoccus cionae TaxID=2035344 RepID=A0A916QUL5_9RHOB|nr:NAD(P)H-hydrate dehydratase [Amylibacter cionae]GGA11902.1 bifunctional NAD(P)H-hydrate repair enzyme [Amylibacter cionae]
MAELLSASQMGKTEIDAIASGRVTGLSLMETAGHSVVSAIKKAWPECARTPHRAVVICGPGNNGGDGFVIARLLAALAWDVEVYFQGKHENLQPDALRNFERWLELGDVHPLSGIYESGHLQGEPSGPKTIIVDAVFGSGLSRAVEGQWAELFSYLDSTQGSSNLRIVAVDVPSGLCSDSGRVLGVALTADLTVTFHRAKIGHYLSEGPELCGYLDVCSIGLEGEIIPNTQKITTLVEFSRGCRTFDKGARSGEGGTGNRVAQHKFDHGHALVCSGPATKTGAARLAARAALRIGTGLVTLASPTDALAENSAHVTAVMLKRCDTLDDLAHLLSDDRISSICVGPGVSRLDGTGALDFEHTRQIVKTVLNAKRKTVLDADALSAFADNSSNLFSELHPSCVLTPHEGEFRRLFPDIHKQLTDHPTKGPAFSKIDAAQQAAERAGCVVLLKGADTVIATPTGRTAVHSAQYDRAAPWLATAGSGDVLAGFICGLLASGRAAFDAAQQAAWLHTECARYFGPGLIAEDLPEVLPKVFSKLQKG